MLKKYLATVSLLKFFSLYRRHEGLMESAWSSHTGNIFKDAVIWPPEGRRLGPTLRPCTRKKSSSTVSIHYPCGGNPCILSQKLRTPGYLRLLDPSQRGKPTAEGDLRMDVKPFFPARIEGPSSLAAAKGPHLTDRRAWGTISSVILGQLAGPPDLTA